MTDAYGGFKIIVDDIAMSKTVEDWSRVRSKGRAARRRKRGFRQNIDFRVVPKMEVFRFGDRLVMHSQMLREFQARIAQQAA